jgi:threonine aldolase
VYVSLYKYFNAPSGAVLAGPRDLLDEMYHPRRMFGGGLAQAWPFAAIALHYLDGFDRRIAGAVRIATDVRTALQRHGAFSIGAIPNGTNLFTLRVAGVAPDACRQRLATQGVLIGPGSASGSFLVAVNETWNRRSSGQLIQAMTAAVA